MRRLLLDSHVLLWALSDVPRLRVDARDLIADSSNYVAVSAVSVWELRIKAAQGKLSVPDTLEEATRRSGFAELPITFDHAKRAAALPAVHGDPFDRMLVAQAQIEQFEIVTRDRILVEYGVGVVAA